ncbi:MAG: hypothetical protein GF313_16875 [Caldithrix sp.]|nr:hypothetical protein [Caldithrix sp.]
MKTLITALLVLLISFSNGFGDEWFRAYEKGQEAMKNGDYEAAARFFKEAIDQKDQESDKIRTYGMHFIEYYPNRELGITLFHLKKFDAAQHYLQKSIRTEPSNRARNFLNRLTDKSGIAKNRASEKKVTPPPPEPAVSKTQKLATQSPAVPEKSNVKMVGERMSVAVFPFENKGTNQNLGEVILDKLITALLNIERFRVIERSQLERILEEQKLSMSGIIDASTAVELGKGIGVDVILLGSVSPGTRGSVSLDARAIDTETATIIVAHDAESRSSDAQRIKEAVEQLAIQFKSSLPLVEGLVIGVEQNQITLDVGRRKGLKKGMKCIIYKEGADVKHPITGELLGKETNILCQGLITEIFDRYSYVRPLNADAWQNVSVGDKFLTK